MEATVAVVGAGPAGCAAALTLRRYLPEMSVVVIAAPAGRRPAEGETLSPGVLPLLAYLGIDAEFRSAGHLPAGGTASAWGSPRVADRSYLFTGRGLGWHLDRHRFDAWLLAQVEGAGARVVHGRALVRTASRTPSRWSLDIKGGDTVAAHAIIDAGGRSAQLARRRGARPRRDDALVAEIRWYAEDERRPVAAGALVESVPDGWWYSATLPEGRAVAMFMTDADLRRQSTWDARLGRAAATADRARALARDGRDRGAGGAFADQPRAGGRRLRGGGGRSGGLRPDLGARHRLLAAFRDGGGAGRRGDDRGAGNSRRRVHRVRQAHLRGLPGAFPRHLRAGAALARSPVLGAAEHRLLRRLAKLLAMQVNMHEAKTQLSELVAAAERGEEVVIARNDIPAARLVPIAAAYAPVRLGVLAGEVELGPDFDEPLPEFEPYAR